VILSKKRFKYTIHRSLWDTAGEVQLGGAVLAELIARDCCWTNSNNNIESINCYNNQHRQLQTVAFLLIAPTTSVIGSLSFVEDAALRIVRKDNKREDSRLLPGPLLFL
jgi:hypothetical protein